MNIQQAIKVIEVLGAGFHGNLAQHKEIQQAINTIIAALNDNPKTGEDKPSKQSKSV